MTDEERLSSEIDKLGNAIDDDWAKLAIKGLGADERKVIREHLAWCNTRLKALREQLNRLRKAPE